jgi:DNA polymerase III sliding clamp (beta) subunit (PCNA family)
MVDYARFSKIVSNAPAEMISLELGEGNLLYVSGEMKGKLKTFPDEDAITPFEDELEAESVEMPIEDLASALCVVSPFSDRRGTNIVFQGVCVRMIGKNLYFIATDNRACAASFSTHVMNVDAVIAQESVDCIINVIGSASGVCKFSIGEGTVSVVSEGIEVSTLIMAEKFGASINGFLTEKKDSVSSITVNKSTLVDAINRCAGFGYGDYDGISLEVSKKSITVTADNRIDNKMSLNVPCTTKSPCEMSFSAPLLKTTILAVNQDAEGNIQIDRHGADGNAYMIFIRQEDRIASLAMQAKPAETK